MLFRVTRIGSIESNMARCYYSYMKTEMYPLTPSTAYLATAALISIRTNHNEDYDVAAIVFASYVLQILFHQPETVMNLPASALEVMGPSLIDNAQAWLWDE